MSSIRSKLIYVVLLAVLPAMAILLYTGLEQRRTSIRTARQEVLLLAHAMAESQKDIARGTRQILSTLALLPQVQAGDVRACNQLFRSLIAKHPGYRNISLIDLDGKVLAASHSFERVYLGDRKHFREALEQKAFAAGEYIVTRIDDAIPAFPFAYPVLNDEGDPTAVLSAVIDLSRLSSFQKSALLPEQGFLSATDHRGIRLFYDPPRAETNPIGQIIKASAWEVARHTDQPGIYIGLASDGIRRIIAYEPVRLRPETAPYMYVWAGFPESHILGPANAQLLRNLVLMGVATLLALCVAWLVGRRALLSPINHLLVMTRNFAAGNLRFRGAPSGKADEFATLTEAFHDMAESLQASQAALVASEEKTRSILNSTAEGIYGLDPAGVCTFCNHSCLKLLGYRSEQELIGRNMHALIHHQAKDGTPIPVENCRIHRAMTSGERIHADSEVLWRADGTCFPAEYWTHFIEKDGEIIGTVVTFIDITERKQAEQERENLIALLQDKAAEQERFVYTVSHDLKGPLLTITGFLELLKQDFQAGDEAGFRTNVAMISTAAQRQRQLLEGLLEFSRRGMRTHPPEKVNLGRLVDTAITSVSGLIDGAGATVDVEGDLPDVVVDPHGFLQVFENLIANAVKFSSNAENGAAVSIGLRRDEGEWVCCVRDNGIGLEPHEIHRVFELFEKVDPDSAGTGLGLAIVKRIVEGHGGRIWAESAGTGQGATFCFTLPLTGDT